MQQHYQTGAKIALLLAALGFLMYGGAMFSNAAEVNSNADNFNGFFGGGYEPTGPMITYILQGIVFVGMAIVFGMMISNPSWNLHTPALLYAIFILLAASSILANQAAFEGADLEPKYWIVGMIAGAVLTAGLFARKAMAPAILAVGAILLFVHTGILDGSYWPELIVASNVFIGIGTLAYGASFLEINPRKNVTTGAAIGAFIMGLMLYSSAILDFKPFDNLDAMGGAGKAASILDGLGSIFIVIATAGTLLAVCTWGLLKFEAANRPAEESP